MVRADFGKKHRAKYEWVDVKEDLPPDDPHNPGMSIPVKVKFYYKKSLQYRMAMYHEASNRWYRVDGMNTIIGPKVIAWTSDF